MDKDKSKDNQDAKTVKLLDRKYRGSGKNKDKKSSADYERLIHNILCGTETFIKLDLEYYLFWPEVGEPAILQRNPDDDTYRIIQDICVISDIFHRYNDFVVENNITGYFEKLGHNVIATGVRLWMGQRDDFVNRNLITEWPKTVRFKSEEGPCFTRLDFDPIEPEDLEKNAPIFHGMLSRMTNSEAFVKKVGSLFDTEAYRKQSIWLYGPTDGGKSAIQKMVMTLVGGRNNTVALTPGGMKSEFYKELLVGKTLWLIREANHKFLNSEEYKSLTGDETHMINPKGRKMFSVELSGQMIFSSNEKPEIRNEDALLRRVIPCLCKPVPRDERIPEDQLWRMLEWELPFIAGYCILEYSKNPKSFIEFDDSELKLAIEESEWGYEALFSQHFAFDESRVGNEVEVRSAYLTKTLFKNVHGRSREVVEFRKWLKSKGCNTDYLHRKSGDRPAKYITGIRRLSEKEYRDMNYYDHSTGREYV